MHTFIAILHAVQTASRSWNGWSYLDPSDDFLGLNEMSARRSHLLQLGTLANHLVEWRCASAPLPSLLRRLHSLRAVLDAVSNFAFCSALRL
jgi:hypothetical protein